MRRTAPDRPPLITVKTPAPIADLRQPLPLPFPRPTPPRGHAAVADCAAGIFKENNAFREDILLPLGRYFLRNGE